MHTLMMNAIHFCLSQFCSTIEFGYLSLITLSEFHIGEIFGRLISTFFCLQKNTKNMAKNGENIFKSIAQSIFLCNSTMKTL